MSQEQSVPQKRDLFDVRGLAWWQTVLALAPIALVFVGGLIGALCAVAAVLVNLKLARSGLAAPIKALTMIAVDAAAVVAWLVIATLILSSL